MFEVNTIKEVNYSLETMSIQGLVCGKEDNENNIVLCLHGWLDNAASFLPLMPYFQKNLLDKHIVAIDWSGHGNSSHKSLDAHYHFIDWTYDLLQLFEANSWQQVDIVAHSMGGMIASAFAAAFPEKVKSLTLIDSIGFISSEAEKKYHSTIESAVQARANVSDLKYEHAKLIVERGIIKEAQGYRWRSDVRLRNTSPYRLTLQQAQQLVRDIKCPVKLIYGSNGLDMVSSGIKNFATLFENFSSVELIGGHHVHMENPEETAELIKEFLAN